MRIWMELKTERYSLKNGDDSEPYLDVLSPYDSEKLLIHASVFRDFSSASHGSESLQKKKFPGCGALKNGASQSFFLSGSL